MRVIWHQGPQQDRKSTEETETKQINLRWEFFDTKAHKKTDRAQKRQKQSKRVFWHQGPQEDRKSTEETDTKLINLRWEVFWHRGPWEDIQSTEETETQQINLRWVFWHQGPQEQKEHRRDRNKANQLKMRVFDTKAHKKTERAQKRQKQSKST